MTEPSRFKTSRKIKSSSFSFSMSETGDPRSYPASTFRFFLLLLFDAGTSISDISVLTYIQSGSSNKSPSSAQIKIHRLFSRSRDSDSLATCYVPERKSVDIRNFKNVSILQRKDHLGRCLNCHKYSISASLYFLKICLIYVVFEIMD